MLHKLSCIVKQSWGPWSFHGTVIPALDCLLQIAFTWGNGYAVLCLRLSVTRTWMWLIGSKWFNLNPYFASSSQYVGRTWWVWVALGSLCKGNAQWWCRMWQMTFWAGWRNLGQTPVNCNLTNAEWVLHIVANRKEKKSPVYWVWQTRELKKLLISCIPQVLGLNPDTLTASVVFWKDVADTFMMLETLLPDLLLLAPPPIVACSKRHLLRESVWVSKYHHLYKLGVHPCSLTGFSHLTGIFCSH